MRMGKSCLYLSMPLSVPTVVPTTYSDTLAAKRVIRSTDTAFTPVEIIIAMKNVAKVFRISLFSYA
jgi:hypothetical protein